MAFFSMTDDTGRALGRQLKISNNNNTIGRRENSLQNLNVPNGRENRHFVLQIAQTHKLRATHIPHSVFYQGVHKYNINVITPILLITLPQLH